jgi:hypothetical protein
MVNWLLTYIWKDNDPNSDHQGYVMLLCTVCMLLTYCYSVFPTHKSQKQKKWNVPQPSDRKKWEGIH